MQFDFYKHVEDIQRATSEDQILEAMRKVAHERGYEHFIISGLPPRGVNVEPFVLAADWPTEWYERYFGKEYTQFDPVARHCFATTLPFFWNEAPYDRRDDFLARRVMDEATDVGLKAGFCVPVHTTDGSQGCVSFGGSEQDLNLEDKLGLHVVSMYAHGVLRGLRRPTKVNAPPTLSDREVEVLKWLSQGKTVDDVGEVLTLSSSTVTFHLQNAKGKLGTSNVVHTVAEAMRWGILPL